MPGNVKNVIAAIDYIESRLHEKLDLDTIAEALHYSKYHLHRMFTGTAGLTIQAYAQHRRLTEAAKLLVFSDKPILEIALTADMKASSLLLTVSGPCIKKPLTSTGRMRNFTRCS